jgi:large subunit ribosomal protein L30
MSLLLVLNIHGKINSPAAVRKALAELKVERRFSASIVTDDTSTVGALKLCKDYIAWSTLDADLLVTLLKERGMVSASHKLDAPALATIGFKKCEDLAEKMMKEQLRLSAIEGVRPFFRLAPPKGGFGVSLRRQFSEKGALGNNPKLPALVRRMI